jgi:hypothetical protein
MWALMSEQRADLFKHVMLMALENLSIAQHRDTLRYAMIRGGGYHPQVRRFRLGDYIYCVKFLALECYFWKDVMASSGKTTRAIAHRVTYHTLMGRYILAHLIFLLG